MRRCLLIIAIFCLLVIACEKNAPLHIGAKDFTEQKILAEIIAILAKQQNIQVKKSIPYGTAFQCAEAIKQGELDLYVEYNGTGLVLLGQTPTSDGKVAFQKVKKLFAPLGIDWKGPLGFANNYVLVMKQEKALENNIVKIGSLEKFSGKIRIGCDPDFVERPLDGFDALLRNYGLTQKAAKPITIKDKAELYDALLDDKLDVVVGYSTDSYIKAYSLLLLKDDRKFFPVYEAAPIIRSKALKNHPAIASVLKSLAGKITTKTMRQMNYKVEIHGYEYQQVAQAFLQENNLLEKNKKTSTSAIPSLKIAMGQLDEQSGPMRKALNAIRKSFAGRPIETLHISNSHKAIKEGQARLSLVGAEDFFDFANDGYSVADSKMESIALIGYRLCHLFAQKDSKIDSILQMKKIGVGPQNDVSHRLAKILVAALKLKTQLITASVDQQMQQLKKGELQGLLLMVPIRHSKAVEAMRQKSFKLISLPEWQKGDISFRYPFLRPSRISVESYKEQEKTVESIESQLVLAAPQKNIRSIGDMGPATGLYTHIHSLSDRTILRIASSLQTKEKLHPILPVSEVLKTKLVASGKKITPTWDSALNAFVILSIIYLLLLFKREE